MATQLCSRVVTAACGTGISAGALLMLLIVHEPARATPVVGQTYGLAGSGCATHGPPVDEFGRSAAGSLGAGRFARVKTLQPIGVQPLNGSGHMPSANADTHNAVSPDLKDRPLVESSSFGCAQVTATESNPAFLSLPVASHSIQPTRWAVRNWTIGSARQTVEPERGRMKFTYDRAIQTIGEPGVTSLIRPTEFETIGGPALSYAIDPSTRLYTTVYMGQNQRPALSIFMRFTPSRVK